MEQLISGSNTIPVPAPVLLLEVLLVFTFILHLAPMNLLFGGSILAAVSHLAGKKNPNHAHLARRISELMPVVIAFTVTLGVAPLLFVQVLYGQFLYSSSILMAYAWFLVVPLVIIGYYVAYLLYFKWEALGAKRVVLAWIPAILFPIVGFIYSNNFSLMLRPETWISHYFENPSGGHLNWSDPALYPRYFHMLLGALAVAGVWIMVIGLRGKSGDDNWSDWAAGYGAKIFLYTTLANILVGIWFLLSLPAVVRKVFMGGDAMATGAFAAAILCIAGAWILIRKSSRAQNNHKAAHAGVILLFVVLIFMAIMRQRMRVAYLKPYFNIDELPIQPQWSVFAVFAITLVLGLLALIWMIRLALRAKEA